jgi:hypothetical protein
VFTGAEANVFEEKEIGPEKVVAGAEEKVAPGGAEAKVFDEKKFPEAAPVNTGVEAGGV